LDRKRTGRCRSIDVFRGNAVVTDEVTARRRHLIVEQMRRTFGIHGTVIEHGQAIFSLD
jgi:hypothetical protein